MQRRTLLKLLAAAAVSGCGIQKNTANGLRVIVVGAGIIGTSIAYHLSKAGASVTVIDKEGPATHASRGTFAWINATWAKQPQYYHRFNKDSLANWKGLQQELGIPIRWHGSLEWFESTERQAKLVAQIAEQVDWGMTARMAEADELSILEPNVNFGGVHQVAFSEEDGAVDPVLATKMLLTSAQEMGAIVQYPCELTDVSFKNESVKATTSLGTITADKLVLATGAEPDASKRFADIVIPQRSRPGVIAITAPMPRLLNRIISAPGIHMHQRDDGRFVLGEQEGAPQNEAHAMRLKGRPNSFPAREIAEQHAGRMLDVAQNFIPELASAKIEDVYIGWRPLPLDGHPVIGASPAQPLAYLAIMHSGVSLAPIVGQLVTHELIESRSIDQLAPYRPDRAFELVKRY